MNILVPANITPREIGIRWRDGFGYEPYSLCCETKLRRIGDRDEIRCNGCEKLKIVTTRGLQYSHIDSMLVESFRTWVAVYTGFDADDVEVTLS